MRRNMPVRGHGGPLMTDHIQLHDLDLELELLKRKREMIEKQQHQLQGGNRPRPFDYDNQPRPLFPGQQFNATPNFARYSELQQNSGYSGGGLLGKRPLNDQPWQGHPAPKRFSGPQSGSKRKFNSGSGPKMNSSRPEHFGQEPQPLNINRNYSSNGQGSRPKSNYPSQRYPSSRGSRPAQRDFRPNKVSKPKQATPGNKVASLPPSERAKLANTVQAAKQDENDPNFILRDDQVPSQQLAGRLELALGNILKEIKARYSESDPVCRESMFVQRQMKQAIRERLRSVMMGKYVGKVGPIVEAYRKVFPVATDTEIVQIALDARESAESRKLAIKLENAGTAYKYVKVNLTKLVGATLDDVFEKLHKLYENEGPEDTKDLSAEILAVANKIPELNEENKNDKNKSKEDNNDETQNEIKESVDDELKEDQNDNSKADKAIIGENKDENLEVNKEENVEVNKEENIEENKEENKDENKEENKDENKDEKATDNEIKDETEADGAASVAKLDSLILSLIRRRLPSVLPRYKNLMMKVLNVCGAYQVTKDTIIENAHEKLKIERRVEEAERTFAENEANKFFNDIETPNGDANASTPAREDKLYPYLVKILGRPGLPKRKIMQTFLKDYKPASVKKHKTLHLLFVAFNNKENFDKIVALKETSIGNCKITIKASEKTGVKPDDSLNATNASSNDPMNTSFSSDLDEQINDLLTSIKKEGENKSDEKSEGPQSESNEGEANLNSDTVSANKEETKPEENDNQKTEQVTTDGQNKNNEEAKIIKVETEEGKDKVEELKNDMKESGRATPTRTSSRLASGTTPSSIRTRRASRLAN